MTQVALLAILVLHFATSNAQKTEVLFHSSSFPSLADVRERIVADVLDGLIDTINKHDVKVLIAPGVYMESLQIDHPALSHTTWEGISEPMTALPTISGGVEVPFELFEPWNNKIYEFA